MAIITLVIRHSKFYDIIGVFTFFKNYQRNSEKLSLSDDENSPCASIKSDLVAKSVNSLLKGCFY